MDVIFIERNFVHLSDLHISSNFQNSAINELFIKTGCTSNMHFEKFMSEIKIKHPEINFIVITGDIVHDGEIESYKIVKDILDREAHVPYFLALGNHDDRKNFNRVFLNITNKKSPYFNEYVLKNLKMKIISLDTSYGKYGMGSIGKKQLNWLDSALDKNNDLDTIIILHHPPYEGDDIDSLKYQLKGSNQLLKILNGHNILGVFAGHIHKSLTYMFGYTPCFVAESISFGLNFTDTYAAANDIRGYNYVKINKNNVCVYRNNLSHADPAEIVKRYNELYSTD